MASLCFPFLPILLLLLPFFPPSSTVAQKPNPNITLGTSLTARDGDSFWSSASGDFAFGFLRQSEGGDYLLAIWFNKIAEKTVVWSANRDKLAPKGSTVLLSTSGRLVLNDPGGNQIWPTTSFATNQSVSYATLLDTGNFILASKNSEILWQSFDYPTDTILPSQILNRGTSLVARYTETNYSIGRFQLTMQIDGNLVLYTRNFPTDLLSNSYWATNTVNFGFQLVFNLSGSIYLIAENKTILNTLSSNNPPTQNFYHRAILEDDGVFRHYVYPKRGTGSNSSWAEAWSVSISIPSNICMAINEGSNSGACGFNSYCRLGDDQRPFCTCPPGYDLFDPNDVTKSCKPKFVSQSCDESSPETYNFDFIPLENADWPEDDYGYFQPVDEDWCRNDCLRDCFCVAAIFRNGYCWKKKFPLSFGRMDSSVGGRALIKIRRDNSTLQSQNFDKNCRNKTKIVIGSVLLGSSLFLNILLSLLTLLIGFRFSKRKSKAVGRDPFISGVNLRAFSYEELDKATRGFREQLGSGAFATVYKGTLDSVEDNNLVAVKKLENIVSEGGEKEFKAEVSAIAQTNHKNLVKLVGFCNEGEHRMLVYEFMENGSLADFLFRPSKPTWYSRIQLILGIARGLSYLHEECSTQIIHCDIKPQNILLDGCFGAKIADFGLAKLLKKDQTRTMTAIRGTKGYVAPEWFRSMPITVKVDVYSFGILLMEMICCRKNFELEAENEDEMILTDWVYDCMKERKMEKLIKNDEEAENDMKRVEKYVKIGIWCIQEEPSLRPPMKKVIQMLEGAVEVSTPPDPSSFISAF
ncbi:G-type lectin S-receptor-like serine/threonine-protein kinase LECRK3 [Benincasa hispida]|uniref:G-type lectin S-receptor-like serine/threonine-protein kinase LECRK3 n=1 Tax=Benincasa hispida TaxID=102211 RepID=UPI001901DF7B|nr:G-type lectin S-receptor-like serine/threonine-protein kinase LECRK3 [Benincasa hispida]